MVFVVYYIIEEGIEIGRLKLAYFKNVYNCMDLAVVGVIMLFSVSSSNDVIQSSKAYKLSHKTCWDPWQNLCRPGLYNFPKTSKILKNKNILLTEKTIAFILLDSP